MDLEVRITTSTRMLPSTPIAVQGNTDQSKYLKQREYKRHAGQVFFAFPTDVVFQHGKKEELLILLSPFGEDSPAMQSDLGTLDKLQPAKPAQ